jgi:predicted dehydrogenase
MTLTVGIIGLASFYGPAYAKRVADRPDCTVIAATATCNDDTLSALGRPTRAAFSDTHDCPVHEEMSAVLEVADAVIVATPTRRRAADARQALDRGVPALVAKPAADGDTAARHLADAATDADVPIAFTTPARYDDAILGVAERVMDGTIGEVQAARAHIRHDRVPAAGIDVNAEHASEEVGGEYAMAVYTADALLWLTPGDPKRVTAEYANVNTPHSAHPDIGTATVRFGDDVLGTMTMTCSTDCRESWGNWEIEVVGTNGILRTNHQGYEGIHWRAGDPDERSATMFARTTNPVLTRTFDAFVETIRNERPWNAPAANHAADALTLCAAWKTAARDGEMTFEAWPPGTTLDE